MYYEKQLNVCHKFSAFNKHLTNFESKISQLYVRYLREPVFDNFISKAIENC